MADIRLSVIPLLFCKFLQLSFGLVPENFNFFRELSRTYIFIPLCSTVCLLFFKDE